MQSSDLLPGTSELGSLISHSNDESQFVGSSSGVYFINTVRQAFAQSLGPVGSSSSDFPAAEDTIVGPESPEDKHSNIVRPGTEDDATPRKWRYNEDVAKVLGQAPTLDQATRLMMMYFKVWHPVFPFLHGPSFLKEMEAFYSSQESDNITPTLTADHKGACYTTIFQCVFNLASLLQPDLQLPDDAKIQLIADTPRVVGMLLYRHDMLCLQSLLALQLYLVAIMSLRNASLVGGCILRSVLHAGLHRCPFRYKELSSHDRQLRKRIFWCAYAIDRYLSQALGLPLGIQDSDLDVCLPGAVERHVPAPLGYSQPPSASPHGKSDRASVSHSSADWSAEKVDTTGANEEFRKPEGIEPPSSAWQQEHGSREATLASFVMYGKLTGRALELFHKSIKSRNIRRSAVLYLVSDVHKWWNNLPGSLQGQADSAGGRQASIPPVQNEDSFDLSPFFSVLYDHLILSINRPCLSLDPSSPDFCSGLQTCIGAARGILSALKSQVDKGQPLFWPGLLSAAYMSGLVIAFACQLRQYVLFKGCQEIQECLDILRIMSNQWETAKHCHTALSFLLLNIQRRNQQQDSYIPYDFASEAHSPRASNLPLATHLNENIERWKRQKFDTPDSYTSAGPVPAAFTISNKTPSTIETDPGPSENPRDRDFHLRSSPRTGEQQQNPQSGTYAPSSSTSREFFPGGPLHFRYPPPPPPPTYETPDSIRQSHYSPLPLLNLDGLEDPQWPGGSTITTNFDLNMTDLFQGSNSYPSLFDTFSHGQALFQQPQPPQQPQPQPIQEQQQQQQPQQHQRTQNF